MKRTIENIYAFPLWLRYYLYSEGIFRAKRLSKPVISVGGIKLGGTGKTPLVEYIAKILLSENFAVTILTRGYGRKSKNRVFLKNSDRNWLDCGDEPFMLSKRLPDVKIAIHPDKFESGKSTESDTDVFVIDDGFQHIQLARNLDVIALSGDEFDDDIFPFGSRRDGLWRLDNLADSIIVVPSQNYEKVKNYFPKTPVFRSDSLIEGLCRGNDFDTIKSVNELEAKKVFLTAGIASPERFETAVKSTGAQIVGRKWFRDHKFFKPRQINDVITRARKNDAEIILTTMKDVVRISGNADDFYVLMTSIRIDPADDFRNSILNTVKNFI